MRIISALLAVGTCYCSNVKTNNYNRKRLVGGLLLAGLLTSGGEPQPNDILEKNSDQNEIVSVAGEPWAGKFDFLDVRLWRAENPKLDSYIAPRFYERFIDTWTHSSLELAKKNYLEYIQFPPKGVYVDLKGELMSVQMWYETQAKKHGIKMEAPIVPNEDIISTLNHAEMKHLIRERIEKMWEECESSGDWLHCEQFAHVSVKST